MTLTQEIVGEFGLPENKKTSSVAREKVIAWTSASDLEALGALYAFIMKPDYAARVRPALTFEDYWTFLSRYFSECFHHDAEGEWAHGRYAAGWDLASWVRSMWDDQQFTAVRKRRLKSWLADLYSQADEDLRRCLVDSALEHMFEDRRIAHFFEDWQHDPTLAIAYKESIGWSASSRT